MKILYADCSGSGNILKDFTRYSKISDYLEDLVNAYTNNDFHLMEVMPLDCAIILKGIYRWIIYAGMVHPDATKNINWLKRQVISYNRFISDKLIIKANGLERECFISWEGLY